MAEKRSKRELERLEFLSKVSEGLRQAEAGKLVSHEEAKRRFLAPDSVWIVESERRAEDLASGAVKSVPAAEAFDNAKRSIAELDEANAKRLGKGGPTKGD